MTLRGECISKLSMGKLKLTVVRAAEIQVDSCLAALLPGASWNHNASGILRVSSQTLRPVGETESIQLPLSGTGQSGPCPPQVTLAS